MQLTDYSTIWTDWNTLSPREKWNRVARRQKRYAKALSRKIDEIQRVEESCSGPKVDRRRNKKVNYHHIPLGFLSVMDLCEKHGAGRMTITRAVKYGCRKIRQGSFVYICEEDFLQYKEDMLAIKADSARRCTEKRKNKPRSE